MAQPVSLDVIQIADPCTNSWGEMRGDERARFCGHCQKSVHDLSAMTRSEAERLICDGGGSLCVRFARDEKGRAVTLDYAASEKPGWRRWWALSMAATVAVTFAGLIFARPKAGTAGMVMGVMRSVTCTRPSTAPETEMVLGKISYRQGDFAEMPPSTLPIKRE